MITLEHVSKTYAAGVPALNDVSLEIEDGEFVFVVGDSGSGKSTLIKLLLKELEPTEGSITIAGKKLGKIRRKQIPKFRRNIGVVFQDFRLLKDRNVYDNVAFAQKVVGEPNSHIKKKVPLMLSMVGLAAKYRSFPKQLSGGEQQRVAIARALINEPSILLADEPTGNLDNNNAWEIMKLLEEINSKGTTVIVVTHNLEIVKVMKKRVITVKKGTIVSDSKEGGLKNIFRNKMFSLASVATMAACIFMFGLFYIIVTNFSATVHSIEEGVSVTVFFENDATDAQIRDIGEKINKRAEVSKNEYVSADEAWKEYKKVYFQGKEELADGFTDNPLANSAHYQVYLNDVSMQDSLVTYIKGLTGVREVKESAQVANTLTDFNKLLGYVSGGIILILLCVAVFLISNTVMVGISVRKEEIAIMKLIGATDFLVRAPFIVEGIVIGLIGAAIPLGVLYFMYQKIIVYIAAKFNFIGSMIVFEPVKVVFRTLIPVGVILGAGIGFIGSQMTIRKHLKV